MVRPRSQDDAAFDNEDSIDNPNTNQESDQRQTIETSLDPRFALFSEIDRNKSRAFVENHSPQWTKNEVRRVGRYTLFDRFENDTAENTYKAFDPKLKRMVVLKVLRLPELSKDVSEHQRSLLRRIMLAEAKAMAQLSHPNIVPIFDVGITDDGIYLAKEFIAGMSLRKWLDSTVHCRKEAIRLVLEAGQGLSAIHGAGFIHRNFVPESIVIGNDGRARIKDFGLVTEGNRDVQKKDRSLDLISTADAKRDSISSYSDLINSVKGTPGYVAPEQYQRNQNNQLSNQFSFAIVLYEAIYGRRPFSSTDLFQAQSARDLQLRFPDRKPRWARMVLRRALAYTPSERYRSTRALIDDVEKHIAGRVTLWWSLSMMTVLAVGVACLDSLWSKSPSACDLATHEISAIWDSEQRERAASAFLASSQRFAVDSWNRSSAHLDNYKSQWIDAYTETCENIQEGSRTTKHSDHLDLKMQCLSRRLEQFRHLADLFENASTSVVEQAISATLQLQTAESCNDPEMRENRFPLPLDPVRRDEVLEVQRALDRNHILIYSGDLSRAEQLAHENLERARQLKHAPLLIDAYTGYADVLVNRWEFQRIVPLLQNALALALSIDDATRAAEIIGNLVHSQSLVSPSLDGLKDLIGWAKALTLRAGTNPVVRANLLNSIGNIYFNFEDKKAAKIAYLEGLSVQGSLKEHRSYLLMNLGQCEIEEKKLNDADGHLKSSLKLIREIYGDDHPQLSHITSVLGTLAYYRGNYLEALNYFDNAILLSIKKDGRVGPQALPSYRNRGYSLRNLGLIQDAISNAKAHIEAEREFSGPNHPRICGNYYRLAEFYDDIGDRKNFFDVVAYLETFAKGYPEDKRCQRNAIMARTMAVIRQRNFDVAHVQLDRAISMTESIGDFDEFELKLVDLRVELVETLGRLEESKQILEQSIRKFESSSWMSLAGHGRMLLRLASVERRLGNFDAARRRLAQAEQQLWAIAGDESLRQAEVELIRGKILLEEKQWIAARKALVLGQELADDVQSSRLLLADLELNLAKANLMQSEFRPEAITLAKQAQERLVNQFDSSHPLLEEVQQFLAECCIQ